MGKSNISPHKIGLNVSKWGYKLNISTEVGTNSPG